MRKLAALAAAMLSLGVLAACDPPPPAVESVGLCTGRTPEGGVPADRFPGAACTGVVNEGALVVSSGILYVDTDGAVVENLDHDGYICVRADDVQIRNVRVTNGIVLIAHDAWGWCNASPKAMRLTLTDVEIIGNDYTSIGIEGALLRGGVTCVRCNIHRVGAGINGGNYVLVDTYIHDLLGWGQGEFEGWSHNDGIQIGGAGGDVAVWHSNIEGVLAADSEGGGLSCSICPYTHGDWGPMDNVLIYNTRIRARSVYCSGLPSLTTNVRFLDNTFVREADTGTCGHGGPMGSLDLSGEGNRFEGNHYDDGAPIP